MWHTLSGSGSPQPQGKLLCQHCPTAAPPPCLAALQTTPRSSPSAGITSTCPASLHGWSAKTHARCAARPCQHRASLSSHEPHKGVASCTTQQGLHAHLQLLCPCQRAVAVARHYPAEQELLTSRPWPWCVAAWRVQPGAGVATAPAALPSVLPLGASPSCCLVPDDQVRCYMRQELLTGVCPLDAEPPRPLGAMQCHDVPKCVQTLGAMRRGLTGGEPLPAGFCMYNRNARGTAAAWCRISGRRTGK